MNAYMRVTIRVTAGNAAQVLNQLQSQINGVKKAAGGAMGATGLGSSAGLEKLGKDIQWTGRQLEYRFTLPIAAAGTAVTKWALDNEKATTQVRKVYGDLDMPMAQVNLEVDKLSKGMRVLSDMFGINQADVINMEAAWAQAGATGVALANATRLTIEASILGEMDQKTAAESLIAIQAQYGLSTLQLKDALATLNVVENQTAVGFSDLIVSMVRAGGTARTAGIDIRQLAALTAALVPAAGSAEMAGNALKTIISRLMAPTKDMISLFGEMGINISSSAWQSKNAADRLLELAGAYQNLTAPQQSVAGSILASRFQVSKFSVLMRELTSETGNYARALDASKDPARNMAMYNKELGIVLASQPQTIKILWTQIKNMATQAIVPLLPYLIQFLHQVVGAVQWFTNLSPAIQKTVFMGLAFLAILGPIVSYIGSFMILGAQFLKVWEKVSEFFAKDSFLMKFAKGFGEALGTLAGWAYSGMSAVARAVAAGWEWIVNGNVLGWIQVQLVNAAGWLKFQAQALLYWGRRFALEAAGWLALKAAAVAAWLAQLAFDAAQWVAALLIDRSGWFARVALAIAEWVSLRAVAVAGWAASLGVEAAGWAAAAETATIGSLAVETAAVSWIPLVIAAVVVAMIAFRDRIGDGVRGAATWMGKLPGVFADVFMAVVGVVGRGARAVFEFLGMLNPFRRRSPSLVDNVIAGVDIIAAKYQSLAGIGAVFREAAADFNSFQIVMAPAQEGFKQADIAKKRDSILAYSPDAGPALDMFVPTLLKFEGILARIGAEYAKQNTVVLAWAASLKTANEQLEVAQRSLDGLKKNADALDVRLNASKATLDTLLNTPIQGMKVYTDQIFQNEMAQKSLRLEILKLEEAGQAVDSLASRMSMLQGEIELLRGQQTDLRRAGADKAILAPIDAQISLMEAQQHQIQGQLKAGTDLQTQLAKVQREGEILNLEQSLKFDPLKKQIADVTTTMKEMPFDELLSKVIAQQAEVVQLTAAWTAADKAVKSQQANVDILKAHRDDLQTVYDIEKQKLDDLGAAYDGVDKQIQDMNSALSGMAASAASASSAMQDFANAANGDFAIPGDKNGIASELGSIDDLVKQWQDELKKKFGTFDLIEPLRRMLDKGKQWLAEHAPEIGVILVSGIIGFLLGGPAGALLGVAIGGVLAAALPEIEKGFQWLWHKIIEPVVKAISAALTVLGKVFSAVWRVIEPIIKAFGKAFEAVWDVVGPIFKFFAQLLYAFAAIFIDLILVHILATWWLLTHGIEFAWNSVLKPVFSAIGSVVRWLWDEVIHPVFGWIGDKFGWLSDIIVPFAKGVAWLFENVIGPPVMALADIFETVFGKIGNFIVTGINYGITAINWLIRGINALSKILPGLDFHIDEIPHISTGVGTGNPTGGGDRGTGHPNYASGGFLPPGVDLKKLGPFVTNGARAIVGEGNPSYPEAVIPTDPRFHGRAVSILKWAEGKLFPKGREMATGGVIPMMDGGGFIGDIISGISDAAHWVEGVGRSVLVTGAFGPVHAAINSLAGTIPIDFVKQIIRSVNNLVYNWAKGDSHKAAKGALVRASSGGSLLNVGEGGKDEAVIPLPSGWDPKDMGKREYHFHGDLSFPNIKSGNDADEFLRNLESLVS